MPIHTIDTYQIGLDIETSDKTKQNIANLKSSFEDTSKSLDDIAKQYADIAKESGDHSAEAKAYNNLLGERLSALNKEADILRNSATETGKRARAELHALKETQKQRRLTKDEIAQMRRLEASVVDLTDEELESRKRANLEARKAVVTARAALKQETIQRKTLGRLIKDDLKSLTERIRKQKEYIASLDKTERKYYLLKKAAQYSFKGSKMGAKAAAGAVGIVGGIVGGAVASAEGIAEKERETRRIKGIPESQKQELVTALQIKTGRDVSSIVDAINRVQDVVKTHNIDDITKMSRAELEFPGASTLFQSQGGSANADDYTILQNRLRKIQSATGIGISDLESSMGVISNLKDRAFKSGVSQQDLLSLYTALKSSNVYDDDETQSRAMRAFLAQNGLNSENFYEKMQAFDWARYARGSQNKNQAEKFIKTFDFQALKEANTAPVKTELALTNAEKSAELARRVAIKKDELVMKVLEMIEPMLNDGTLEKLINSALDMVKAIMPLMKPVLDAAKTVFEAISPHIETIVKRFTEDPTDINENDNFVVKTLKGVGQGVKTVLGQSSQGSIALGPTIAGERGPEAIIPLDFARAGRSTNIINNINQNFNMAGSQTTALSMAQAVKQRSFTDNLISHRLYGG